MKKTKQFFTNRIQILGYLIRISVGLKVPFIKYIYYFTICVIIILGMFYKNYK